MDFVRHLEDQVLKELPATVTLECELTKANVKVAWQRGKTAILPSAKYEIQVDGTVHCLIIKDATAEDIGQYMALARSKTSEASLSIEGELRAVPTRATYNPPMGIGRFQSADSSRGNTISGQILNMFNTESWLTLQRISRRLWRIGHRLYYPHTHTPIVEESALESVLESADYSSKSADSNADSPKVGLWVWAFRVGIAYLCWILNMFITGYAMFLLFCHISVFFLLELDTIGFHL